MLDIEIGDDQLRSYIKGYINDLMERKVYNYLQHQLKNTVENRIAALRLQDPNFPSFDQHIDNYIREELNDLVESRVRQFLPDMIRIEIQRHMAKIFPANGEPT